MVTLLGTRILTLYYLCQVRFRRASGLEIVTLLGVRTLTTSVKGFQHSWSAVCLKKRKYEEAIVRIPDIVLNGRKN